jgi:hypothetical protein
MKQEKKKQKGQQKTNTRIKSDSYLRNKEPNSNASIFLAQLLV